MRILHAGIFHSFRTAEHFYSTDRIITHGLVRLGHFVYDYSYRDVSRFLSPIKSKKFGQKRMLRHFLDTIDNLQPELILLGHTETIGRDTLREIRKNYPDTKLAMWYVDPLYKAAEFQDKLEFIDAFFATTAGPWLQQLEQYTDAPVMFMPNICDCAVNTVKAFENPQPEIDLSFIGGASNGTAERTAFIKTITEAFADINFRLFGQTVESRVMGYDYLRTVYNSKMSLSINRVNDQPLYTSDRLAHLTANGTAVISPEVPDLRKLFNDNELIYYKDTQDLISKVHHYLEHPDERIAIARAGHARAHKSYNSERVCKFLLEAIFQQEYSEQYEWV